jgi:DNA-binding transcriptional regulator YiaG
VDKRYKPLTPQEMLAVRRQLELELASAPATPIPVMIRKIRTALRFTIEEYAQICGISGRALSEIERGAKSPTLATVEKLLRPMGMVPGAVSANAIQQDQTSR